MPAASSSPTLTVVDDSDPLIGELSDVPPAPDGLLELLALVPDPRKPRGIRHDLTGVLAVALSAVIAGAQSFVAIAEWAADAAPEVLAMLGVTGAVPSESTIRRCLQKLAPDELDKRIGAWMWLRTATICGRRVIAFDGKTLRGAKDAAGNLVHLLAGLCQSCGAVLAQIAVGAKTSEIPMLRTLLDTPNITGAVITADALHCQRETAQTIIDGGGHYILTVKDNQPTLRRKLKNLPWKQIPVLDKTTEHGHGRTAKRVLKATEITEGIGFPGAVQVL
jgi:predicted transposase YbfD/YdcC